MKQRIRLTENELNRIVRRCINEAVNELSIKSLENARDAARDDYSKYGQLAVFPNKKFDNFTPSKHFTNAIGNSSKTNAAKLLKDRRLNQEHNFNDEIKRRKQSIIDTIYNNQAEFENACDYLYYGESGKDWKEKSGLDDATANLIWKVAHQYMSQDECNNWKSWIQGYGGGKDFFGGYTRGGGIDWDEF